MIVGLAGACDAASPESAPDEPAVPQTEVDAEPRESPKARPPAPTSLLAGVLERAIVPPPEGGSTYRVDAYVAALVVEQLGRDSMPFTPWRDDQADDGAPTAGYRVGPLAKGSPWRRLGLAEGDINGRDLTNDLEAMQLYMGLSSTRTFRVRYVRGGSTRNKTIVVK